MTSLRTRSPHLLLIALLAPVGLGYFPNVTHATAVAGIEKGIYGENLGTDKLVVQTFNAGPAAVEALFAEGLDGT